jgi:hypothetical protein
MATASVGPSGGTSLLLEREVQVAALEGLAEAARRGGGRFVVIAPVDLAYEHRGLVVEVRHGPAAAVESALGSSSRPPIPCITPSTETNVVVSFMVAVPFSLVDFVGHGTVRAANRSACRFGPLSS